MMMVFFYLIILITQAVAAPTPFPPFPFPQGKYGVVQLRPAYLRLETTFATIGGVHRVHLRLTCGPSTTRGTRSSWDGWFDIIRGQLPNLFTMKEYLTSEQYASLFSFYKAHCGRGQGSRGDLAVFSKDPNSNKYATRLGKDTIFLQPDIL
ncbi:hypothetical protein FOZ60_004933 [Perkinsus olseni]|uniref:Uncharacterized protein n=1 Tax=Perkinsus olseni TaxID=32597 RepID=A0A7J6NSB6_PEROL|nr:hypothetical protein FOZ60_004933 [Perkinsus olseni]KAF4742078.1 hypothetical protein FOZ62_028432 [Perkinsus olseni]